MTFKVPEQYRVKHGPLASSTEDGCNGAFEMTDLHGARYLTIVSDGLGWEHVSVSLLNHKRCPTWEEMCKIKELFWDEEDCVVQYHPPKSDHVSIHHHCLHLWRPTDVDMPRPPSIFVGPKGVTL